MYQLFLLQWSMTACINMANFVSYIKSNVYIYTPLRRPYINLYRYILVFIVSHVDIEIQDNKQFISNIPRRYHRSVPANAHIVELATVVQTQMILKRK